MIRPIALIAALAIATGAGADDVRLRDSVRLDAGAELVRLRDIATLDGPAAHEFADTVVAKAPSNGRPIRVSIGDVRQRLREIGAPLGRINLSGNVAKVRPRRNGPGVLQPMAVVSLGRDTPAVAAVARQMPALEATDLQREATLRGAIVRYLLHQNGLAPEDLRVRFDGSEADDLLTSTHDCLFTLDPRSSLDSPTVRIVAGAWRNGTVESEHEVTVQPLTRVQTATATRELRRNDEVRPGDLIFDTEWVAIAHARLVEDGQALVGRIATRLIRAGDRVVPDAVRRQTVVERGDEITVRRRVGDVAISVRAEAREDGVRGQVITARRPGERDEFLVRVVGPHEAVIPDEPHEATRVRGTQE